MKRVSLLLASLFLVMLFTACGGNPSSVGESSDASGNLLGENDSTTAESTSTTSTVSETTETSTTASEMTTTTTTTATVTETSTTETTATEPVVTSDINIVDIVMQCDGCTLFLADNGDVYMAGFNIFDWSIQYRTPAVIFSGAKSIISEDNTQTISIVGNDNNYYIKGLAPDGTTYDTFTACMSDVDKAGNGLILKMDGSLYIWGSGTPPQLLNNVKDFYGASDSGYALTDSGDLYAWGSVCSSAASQPVCFATDVREAGFVSSDSWYITNSNVLYEVSKKDTYPSPVKVADNVKTANLNTESPAYITIDNKLYMWGYYNSSSYDNLDDWVDTPEFIADNVVQVASWYTNMYLDSSGNLITFGKNQEGSLLGIDQEINYSTEKNVILTGIQKLYFGLTSYAVTTDGDVYAWGGNWCFCAGVGSSPEALKYEEALLVPIKVVFP